MGIIDHIDRAYSDALDRLLVSRARKAELDKFKDPRRKAILARVCLSDSQMREIDAFYEENYGGRIPYTWHQHAYAISGVFDRQVFPEILFVPEFERFMNCNKSYARVYSDKNVLPMVARSMGIKMPATLLSCSFGVFRDERGRGISKEGAAQILSNLGEVFIKPSVDSCSGKGCFLADFQRGADHISGWDSERIIESLGGDFVVQEKIVCHPTIRKLHPSSVNTFRVMTYRWDDSIDATPTIMRIGRGSGVLDNAHAGGIFIGVSSSGTLNKKAITEFGDEFYAHPDSGVIFEGHEIASLSSVVESAQCMHDAMPQVGIVSWDFTVDYAGDPVLIEANIGCGSIWLPQMAHGVGAFGDNTSRILKWTRAMKKTRLSERHKYAFGKMPR